MKRLRSAVLVVLFSIVIVGIIAEIVVRLATTTDLDGQRYFLGWPIPPSVIPVRETKALIDQYLASDDSLVVYEPLVGWAYRPSRGEYNAAGLRADHDYPLKADDDVVRIALFGDSFTHGDDVTREESWPYLLEQQLNAEGIHAEVLNFGVGGYGFDQAYLAWQQRGQAYHPDFVVLGFAQVDVSRLLSIYWKFIPGILHVRTANPFTKPRFILDQDDALALVNSPTVPPEQLPDLLAHYGESPLAQYDEYYHSEDYDVQWWMNSYLLSAFAGLGPHLSIRLPAILSSQSGQRTVENPFDPQSEGYRLTMTILDEWAAAVDAQGGRFMVIHLPLPNDLRSYQSTHQLSYGKMRDEIASRYTWIETIDQFPPDSLESAFTSGGHYSPSGSPIIADVMAQTIKAAIGNAAR